jgi:hypothetical protein
MCGGSSTRDGHGGLFDFVSALPSREEIQKRINNRYDDMTVLNVDGSRTPRVCVLCDEFIVTAGDRESLSLMLLRKVEEKFKWSSFGDPRRSIEIERYYQWNGVTNDCPEPMESLKFLYGMALSPRSTLHCKISKGKSGKQNWVFDSCRRCYLGCRGKEYFVPRHSILNRNYYGEAPDCLTCLTEVELAFVTPMKNYGFCFTWRGGSSFQMQGALSFMKVRHQDVGKAVATMNEMGLNANVICLITGNMTPEQREKAKNRCEVRIDKVTEAVKWLICNNVRWKDVDFEKLTEDILKRMPVVIDRCKEVQSEDSNLEKSELFTCYYPDGAVSQETGGFLKADEFKELVKEMAVSGFDPEFQFTVEREYFKGTDSDLLLDSCLLQFPYGIGGLSEARKLKNGSFDTNSNLSEFFDHLSRKSNPTFQHPLFQLISYSMLSKSRLLRSSTLQLRGKTGAKNMAEGFNPDDVISAINGRKRKNHYAGTNLSRRFLDAVDATARSLPHTDEAARVARNKGESMQHHFGMPSVFLTMTFDDEQSFLMQVLSGRDIDDKTSMDDLNDEEINRRFKLRKELRVKYPGIASIHFEMLLDIIFYDVIGWDRSKNCATEHVGFFGSPEAVFFCVEEQGRKTLHTHILMYIRGYGEVQNAFFFPKNAEDRDWAEDLMSIYTEHCGSTQFFPTEKREIRKAFNHQCSVPQKRRHAPHVISDQGLRDLRNREGYKHREGKIALCRHCPKTWTYEQLVSDCLVNLHGFPEPEVGAQSGLKCNRLPVLKKRCYSKCVEFQMGLNEVPPCAAVNAAYQAHESCHVSGCFRCQKAGKKRKRHVCGPNCECRFHLPDRKRIRAEVFKDKENANWYSWNGTYSVQSLSHMIPKRNYYDVFQNVACNAISNSKLCCNTNVTPVIDGPIGQYIYKYCKKGTQQEDEAPYAHVEASIKSMNRERVHQTDRAEALRLICRAAFAHNRRNVVSAPFASYFLRNDSRFYFSHEFAYCPLRDVLRLHSNQEVNGMLYFNVQNVGDDTSSFFENIALNYLCRNAEINVCLKDFVELYETKFVTKKDDDDKVFPFQPDTGYFQHPSVQSKGWLIGQCSRASKLRDVRALAQVSQWMFPDTASFGCDILSCSESEMTSTMESYAELVLCLLYPHWHRGDLMSKNCTAFFFVHKLQEVYRDDEMYKASGCEPIMFSDRNVRFLQNLQNARSNTLRYSVNGDDLSSRTVAFTPPEFSLNRDRDDTDDCSDASEDEIEETPFEEFQKMLMQEDATINEALDDDPKNLPLHMNGLSFNTIRNRGINEAGWRKDIPTPEIVEDVPSANRKFLNVTGPPNCDEEVEEANSFRYRKKYSVRQMVKLHLKRTEVKTKNVCEDITIEASAANGSIKSIREWGAAAFKGDKHQRRAFEVLTAAFLLTFYEDTEESNPNETPNKKERAKYRVIRNALKRLRGCRDEYNLICLLHGPGGSGKSTVLNCVRSYAKEFCELLGHPFTNRTIIFTAMSGVAATLINGETTHSVLGLNRSKIQQEEVIEFSDARLIIIDEISFASADDFTKIHERLQFLMESKRTFGGLNIVFSGDYSQLEPVKKDPIYKGGKKHAHFHDSLNCYIELRGNWRFRKDPAYGEMMGRFRNGNPTIQDINILNQRVIRGKAPKGIQVATYANCTRDAVNSAVFDDYCAAHGKDRPGKVLTEAVMILMDQLTMNDSAQKPQDVTSNSVKKWFYQNCGENNLETSGKKGRVDPVLKLYPNAPMMFTSNKNVMCGEANGSRVYVNSVHLKVGEVPFLLKLDNGTSIQAVMASQVQDISLEHENKDISPRFFKTQPQKFNFSAKIDICGVTERMTMSGNQFPIISNTATTGHKLQGCSLDAILVNDWCYKANWVYVVLSRVKTLAGLYLRQELSYDLTKYQQSQSMKDMMESFQKAWFLVEYFDEQEYEHLVNVGSYDLPEVSTPDLHDDMEEEANF